MSAVKENHAEWVVSAFDAASNKKNLLRGWAGILADAEEGSNEDANEAGGVEPTVEIQSDQYVVCDETEAEILAVSGTSRSGASDPLRVTDYVPRPIVLKGGSITDQELSKDEPVWSVELSSKTKRTKIC